MIFRLTHKLAGKVKVDTVPALSPCDNPFLDWTANLFMVSRWQCIILTNSVSLYSVVLRGKGIPTGQAFVKQGMDALRQRLALDGLGNVFETEVAPYLGTARFCKAGDRSVLASMNQLVFYAKSVLLDRGDPLPLVNLRINRIPMSKLEYHYSVEEFAALAGQPLPSGKRHRQS